MMIAFFFNKKGFEFVNKKEDDWIASLYDDACFGKSLERGSKSEKNGR